MARFAISNGNGCTCDNCNTILYPHEAIKVKAYIQHDDWKKASQGQYKQISKIDLCKCCYELLFGYVARQNVKGNSK